MFIDSASNLLLSAYEYFPDSEITGQTASEEDLLDKVA